MSLIEDIEEAKKKAKIKRETPTLYTSTSHIYRSTNENMKDIHYVEQLQDREKVLSVIGSGDQILNSILFGTKEIDAFDISRFPKYFLDLKLAAIKQLDYEDYISFFYGKKAFDRRTFNKLVDSLQGDAKDFWSKLVAEKGITSKKLYRSTLFTGEDNIDLNPYLEEDNYQELKRKMNGISISYKTGNIMHLGLELEKDYDLINLSNICMYQFEMFTDYPGKKYKGKFRPFIKNLRLNPNGVVLNYLMGYKIGSSCYRYVENYYKEDPDFRVFEIENPENINDALLIYQKKK